jgi:protein O-mannosyl-transferase
MIESKRNQKTGKRHNQHRQKTNQSGNPPGESQPLLHNRAVLVIIILVITFIAFLPSLSNQFITSWDDQAYVTDNQTIRHLNSNTLQEIFTTETAGSYVPLPLLTFAIEYKLFGLNPFYFHLTNLLLHLLCTFLVFHFFRLLKLNPIYAATGALLFSVHPMHVESVAWVTERKDLLYCLFYLASVIFYIEYINASGKKLLKILLCLFFFILSLFSKITAVTLPLCLFLIDYYFYRPFKIRLIFEKIPFFILSLVFGLAEIIIFQTQGILNTTEVISLPKQIFLEFYALSAYIFKFFIPFRLSALYPSLRAFGPGRLFLYYISPVFIIFIGYLVYRASRKNRAILFGTLFFVINIILINEAQLLSHGTGFLADRFSYLSYLGLCFIAGWSSQKICTDNKKYERFLPGAVFLMIMIFTGLTISRNKDWKDSITLWNDVIGKFPNKISSAYSNRAAAWHDLGQFDNAIADYTSAIGIKPKDSALYNNRGVDYDKQKQLDLAIADYNKAINFSRGYAIAYNNRGFAYAKLEQWDKAIADYSSAIGMDPNLSQAYANRGGVYYKFRQWDKAIADFSRIIRIDPNNTDAYFSLGLVYSSQNNFDAAIEISEKALKIDDQNFALLNNLGYYYIAKGNFDKAIENFHHCLKMENNIFLVDPTLGIAMAYYYKNDKENARKYFDKAKEIKPILNNGMSGLLELEKEGYSYSEKKKETLKAMFAELK